MARNGSGTYALASGNPVVTGTSVSSTWANNTLNDLASAVTQSISNDGQTPITANLPMTGFKHTNVANATARTDYCTAGQSQDNTFDWLTSVAGTDTITASAAIGLASYAAGQTFRFIAAGANTTTSVTLNLNSLGAKAITKSGTTALAIGDIPSGCVVEIVYDGTRFQLVGVSVNHASSADTATSATTSTTATNIAGGASGSVPYQTGSGATTMLAKGTNGQILTLAAGVPSWATLSALTAATAQASTSGTSIDFTGIPAGTKRITVMFSGVSTNGASNPQVQLGAGSPTTTGYTGYNARQSATGNAYVANSAGFILDGSNSASTTLTGHLVFTQISGNTWVCSGVITSEASANESSTIAGVIALAGTLDRVRITTVNGTDTFDAGSINIMYE